MRKISLEPIFFSHLQQMIGFLDHQGYEVEEKNPDNIV